MAKRQINLNVGINTMGYLSQSWKYRTGTRADVADFDYFVRLTELAHRGLFDTVFLSDIPALPIGPGTRPFQTLEPITLLTALGARVPDIGLVATISSSFNTPFNLARRAQTADIISGGRLVVNIVSTFNPKAAANFGSAPLPPREERYARANEFIEVCKKLWGSWDPARESDIPPGEFWDSSCARPINHVGKHFSVKGPLNVPRGPQGHPVLAQAGGSDDGIDLAARHGEMIYCNVLSRGAGQEFRRAIHEHAVSIGRDPAGIRIMPGLVPVIADSYEEALRKHELYSGAGSEDGLLRRFAAEIGIEARDLDPDAVIAPETLAPDPTKPTAMGFRMGIVRLLRHERLSARQLVRRSEGHHRLLLGTPEQIAEGLIDLWADGTVDGYTIQPPRAPDDIELFVEKVIPILQDRGVYRRRYEEKTVRERYGLPFPP
jgi:FMN-dependent oxidoreductase (nitrilotriacetate monooxygenase family)